MAEKFKKKNLNKEDHEKEDKRAKHIRGVLKTGGTLAVVASAAFKFGPKIIKTIGKI